MQSTINTQQSAIEDGGHLAAIAMKDLLEAGVHFGHQTKRWNPKMKEYIDGIRGMSRLPDAIFVVDTRKEQIAVDEARKLKIPVIGIVDTNCDPDEVDFVIPGNDDALRAIRLFASRIADAVISGRDMKQSFDAEAARDVSDESDDAARRQAARPARRAREVAPASA